MIMATALLFAVVAQAGTWTVADGSEVVFTSKAPMESFDGRTSNITGHLACNPEDLAHSIDLNMVVDMASLDTGIGLRNNHMRDNHLETDTYPTAVFTGGTIVGGDASDLRPGATTHLEVQGVFDLHGVARDLVVPADVTMATDGSLTVSARFMVKLSDHEIKRPKFLVMKLADEQAVKVTLNLQREASP